MKIIWLLSLLLIPSICFGDSESTIGGKTGTDHIIQDEGVSLRPRPYLNFKGSSVACVDTGGKTVCTITGGSGSGPSSVSNSDGTLTISPTIDAVVASLNLSHANTWTAEQKTILSTEQQRLGFNSSNYFTTTIDSLGNTTFDAVGTNPFFSFSDTVKLRQGGTAAGSDPLRFTSGALLTSPVIGTEEFLTDNRYITISTGTARKEYTLNDNTLTTTRVPFATTNGRLTDSANLTFSTATLTLGVGNSTQGFIALMNNSGVNKVTLAGPSVGSSYTFTFPNSASSTNVPLVNTGTGTTAFQALGIVGGGTGNTSYAAGGNNGIVYYDGSKLTSTTGGASNTVLHGNGSSAPTMSAITAPDILAGSNYVVGDLLTANTTTTLSRLADAVTGDVLISGGVGVAPSYSASPTVSNIILTAGNGGSTNGQVWNDTTQNIVTFYNGNTLYQGGNLYTASADTVITSASATTSFSSSKIGTTIIKANTLKIGQKFAIWGAGYYSTPIGNTATVTITAKIGSTTISTVTTGIFPASATNLPFNFLLNCTVRSIGGSATLVADGRFEYYTALSGIAPTSNSLSSIGTISFDSTINEAVDVQANWSAVTTHTATVQQAKIDFL